LSTVNEYQLHVFDIHGVTVKSHNLIRHCATVIYTVSHKTSRSHKAVW